MLNFVVDFEIAGIDGINTLLIEGTDKLNVIDKVRNNYPTIKLKHVQQVNYNTLDEYFKALAS